MPPFMTPNARHQALSEAERRKVACMWLLGGVSGNLLDASASALKFVGCWFLEERNQGSAEVRRVGAGPLQDIWRAHELMQVWCISSIPADTDKVLGNTLAAHVFSVIRADPVDCHCVISCDRRLVSRIVLLTTSVHPTS